MKVLHVYKTYFPDTFGGVEQLIAVLAKQLMLRDVQSEIFCLTPNVTQTCVIDGICVHKVKQDTSFASTPMALSAFAQFKERASKFDMIHYHFPYPFADLLHFVSGIQKPFVITYHSDIVKQRLIYPLYKPLMTQFLKRAHTIIATSPRYVDSSLVLQQHKEKTAVIPIGIDASDYPQPTMDGIAQAKARFGDRFFLFVGVLRYYKGLAYLIEAARGTDIPIVIAGAGPIADALKSQANGLPNIYFTGAVTEQEKIDLLNACCGFVFPSHVRSEAFGISLLEGALFKKPLISCEIGTGTSYINQDGETGYVVAPRRSDLIRDALKKLHDDIDHANQMGQAAYHRYQKLFQRDAMVDAYAKLYSAITHA